MPGNMEIDGGRAFDWSRSSQDYARYRDIYPPELYRRLLDLSLCTAGQHVLDLGTGTGVLPRAMAQHGARFTAVDEAPGQVAEGRRLAQQAGLDIDFAVGRAEDIHFAPGTFDVVTACQCFIYFNKAVVLPKIHNALKPGGHFCTLWMGWLPHEDAVAAASEALVLQYNPHWTGGGATRPNMAAEAAWAPPLFRVAHAVCCDLPVPFTRESWHGRMRACRGVGASSLAGEALAEFDRAHRAMLKKGPEHFEVLHYVSLVDAVRAE